MKKIAVTTIVAVFIIIIFFYFGVFSPLKDELENSLQHNFLNKISINEVRIENRFDRYIEGTKSLSSRTMIKNKLNSYYNNQISFDELHNYTQSKYVDGVKALDNILAAYRITKDNKIVAQFGEFNLEKIKQSFDNSSSQLKINLIEDKSLVIINSPIINNNGENIGNDITVFDLKKFMQSLNSNNIKYEIIYAENIINYSRDQENQVVEYRKLLNTNYWLKAVESKNSLYDSLNSITTRIVILFSALLISFLLVFYKIIRSNFHKIITELKSKIKELNKTKNLLENLTNQVPGALYQFQSKSNNNYIFSYASYGLKDLFGVKLEEAKESADKIFSKIHDDDYEDLINSIEKSKKNLTTWDKMFRVKLPQQKLKWLEGSAQPEKLDNGEVLWHGYVKDITERKNEKDELETQHQFQKSLANVSSILVNLSSDNFDQKIDQALEEIGQFFDIERIQIFKLSEDKKLISSINEWHGDNMSSIKDKLQKISLTKIPWWFEQVKNEDFFTVCNVDNLPTEAENDKKFLKAINIKSAASKSIYINDELFGFYAFANMKDTGICQSEKIKYINIFTEVLTRAIDKNLNERKIEKLSYYDSLTGLYNRRFFEEEMKRLNTTRNLPMSIIIADLNGLKIINDSYGHEKGDQILVQAAQILKSSLREEDILARYGGDEFAVLLPKTTKQAAERIEKRIKEKCKKTKNDLIPISIALGRATKEKPKQDIEEILKKADDTMYKNKLSESRSSKSNIVQGLINVLNSKSNETKEHSIRMTKIAFEFGQKLNLSNAEQNRLSVLATLHDIGKININKSILKKKDSLNDEEWEAIKKHSEYGYKIAKSSEEFAAVAEDILAHHEHWNGEGYPHSLKEKNIPYLARIISIIDAYDVMTHDRPYKNAISKEEALAEIKRCSGSQFDPDLAEIFIEMLTEE
jgi:diguanylate cyclase (GGDEF)-like protein